jgi:nicotinamide phosphoribosyltransferase
MLAEDMYKVDHHRMLPARTQIIYSNFTPRGTRRENNDQVVWFGAQYFLKEYLGSWQTEFFARPFTALKREFQEAVGSILGCSPASVETDHWKSLWDLGHLPILIKSLPEGQRCPYRVPVLTIRNTDDRFAWLTNFLESILSNVCWHPTTTATTAFQFRLLFERYARETSDDLGFVKYQAHDFSMRGQTSFESTCVSGGAWLTAFVGSDVVPALPWLHRYYGADHTQTQTLGSVVATEHSVMTIQGREGEAEVLRRLLTETYPSGVVSVVCDSYDYWHALDVTLRELRDVILNRPGKLVVRGDSGDPVKISAGDPDKESDAWFNDSVSEDRQRLAWNQWMGSVRLLSGIFGAPINSKGYRQLDPHVGYGYGDGITEKRADQVCQKLKDDGFASTNWFAGVGSYSIQYATRDTDGWAVKCTAAKINGNLVEVYKDPATDSGMKKSARGLLAVWPDPKDQTRLKLFDRQDWEGESTGCLRPVFENGEILREQKLEDIRRRVDFAIEQELAKEQIDRNAA